MDSFTPSGIAEPTATADLALLMLRDRLNIDFTDPYRNATNRRHELAVVAVDVGRRMLDLRADLTGRAERDMVVLGKVAARSRDLDDFSGDPPEVLHEWLVPALHARVAELDRTLRLLAVAYRQAWWADTLPAAPAEAAP